MFYLPSPIHSKFINTKVVARYLPVGGVRIEDDILITSKGYENLTTAPKGDAMLDIIRGHHSRRSSPTISRNSVPGLGLNPSQSRDNQAAKQAQPLRRAPGISQDPLEPILKPISQSASAEPKARSPQRRSGDFEPFNGPSLFENFKPAAERSSARAPKRATTYDDTRSVPTPQETRKSVCGDDSPEYSHAYMNFNNPIPTPTSTHQGTTKPLCRKCAILIQTIDRLRHNFQKPDTSAPTPAAVAIPRTQRPTLPESQHHRRPIRPSTLPDPNLPYRQSLPNLKQPQLQNHSTNRPLFTTTFTSSPQPDRGQPWDLNNNEFAAPRRSATLNMPYAPAAAAPNTQIPVPNNRRLSATLDLVEEELIDAVRRLRVIGARAEEGVERGLGDGRWW